MGPTTLFHLGGDEGGLADFCARYADSFNRWWDNLGTPYLDPATVERLVTGFGATTPEEFRALAARRDALLTAVVAATHALPHAGGRDLGPRAHGVRVRSLGHGGRRRVAGTRLTWEQVAGRRMARQGLLAPLPGGPADVVRAMCGAQAQIPSAAQTSVALRAAGTTTADVSAAVQEDRTLVRTFGPRGTVHLFAADDLVTWLAAAAALPAGPPQLAPGVALDDAQLDAVLAAVDDALGGPGAVPLTIDELTDAVVARAGAWAGDRVMPAFGGHWPRWRQALSTAATRGLLCYGPARGRATTFTGPRSWLPGFDPAGITPDAGPLLHRYLAAYGPARPEDLARWLAVPPAWAAEQLAALDLEPVAVEGAGTWRLPDDPAEDVAAQGVRLLPYFDAYVIAAAPRALLFPGRAAERALTRGQAGNRPVVLVDGVVGGIWHARTTTRTTHVTVELWDRPTTARRRALEHEVGRLGEVTGTRASFELGDVIVGPHA